MHEAFVYSWRNKTTNRLYIGWHKGSTEDGYICSSKILLEEYQKDSSNFERFIIAHGTAVDMAALETSILKSVDAKNNPEYYNQHNGNGLYHLKGHSDSAKRKISQAKLGKKRPDVTARNLRSNPAKDPEIAKLLGRNQSGKNNSMFGKKHSANSKRKISQRRKGIGLGITKSAETKAKMAEARKQYWLKRKGLL